MFEEPASVFPPDSGSLHDDADSSTVDLNSLFMDIAREHWNGVQHMNPEQADRWIRGLQADDQHSLNDLFLRPADTAAGLEEQVEVHAIQALFLLSAVKAVNNAGMGEAVVRRRKEKPSRWTKHLKM